jgi:predicted nucleic acid-binding protein
MTLYLDTSALLKLYVREPHSTDVADAVETADAIATSLLAYPEMRASLARAKREHRLSPADYHAALTTFLEDWEHMAIVETHDAIMKSAGSLAEQHALRGTDAIHLASALHIAPPRGTDRGLLQFLAFDKALVVGAHRARLSLHPLSSL